MKKKTKEEILKILAKTKYKQYYPEMYYFEEALRRERMRALNCTDGYFDPSAAASNRRILNDINRMKEQSVGFKKGDKMQHESKIYAMLKMYEEKEDLTLSEKLLLKHFAEYIEINGYKVDLAR